MRAPPVSLNTSQLSTVPKASVPALRGAAHCRLVVEQPAHLGGRRNRDRAAGRCGRCTASSCPRSLQLVRRNRAVRRSCQTIARASGSPRRAVPRDHRLALVGDADARRSAPRRRPGSTISRAQASVLSQISPRIVLDPAGPRIVLGQLALRRAAQLARRAANSIARVEVVPSSRTRISLARSLAILSCTAPYAAAWHMPPQPWPTGDDRAARAAGAPRARAQRLALHLHRHADLSRRQATRGWR